MITIFNSKSVYLGTDMKAFNEMRNYLETNHIPYKYKVKNHQGQAAGRGTVRGNTGSAGNASGMTYEYEILVHKKDYDKVR